MKQGQLAQRILVLVTLSLVAFGLVMVYSATSASAALGNGDPMSFLKRQAVYALVGVIVMTAAARFDYHRLRYLAPPLLLVALVLSVLTVTDPAVWLGVVLDTSPDAAFTETYLDLVYTHTFIDKTYYKDTKRH